MRENFQLSVYFLSNKKGGAKSSSKAIYDLVIPGLVEGFYLNLEAAVFSDYFHRLFVCVEAENFMLHKVSSLLKQKIMLHKVLSLLK